MSLKVLIAVGLFCCTHCLQAAPQQLLNSPLESPDSTYSANVEWDAAGFIGRIRMLIDKGEGKPTVDIELPQIKPSPANLTWITSNWVACESFVAENGAAFFYVDALREKGYMIEIFAPQEKGDWLISYTTNDSVSSDTINVLSVGRSSLFPILLRNLPEDGVSYLSPDFPYLLADAVDSFVVWRKSQKFVEMEFLTTMAENPHTGRLVVASVDDTAEIVYFPQGTTTTREMLALTQRKPLPETIQKIIDGVDPPTLSIEWTDSGGQFRVLGSWDNGATVTEMIAGRFEGVSDSAYTGPGVEELLKSGKGGDSEDKGKTGGKISITDSKKKSVSKTPAPKKPAAKKSKSKSANKKPSRSD